MRLVICDKLIIKAVGNVDNNVKAIKNCYLYSPRFTVVSVSDVMVGTCVYYQSPFIEMIQIPQRLFDLLFLDQRPKLIIIIIIIMFV